MQSEHVGRERSAQGRDYPAKNPLTIVCAIYAANGPPNAKEIGDSVGIWRFRIAGACDWRLF